MFNSLSLSTLIKILAASTVVRGSTTRIVSNKPSLLFSLTLASTTTATASLDLHDSQVLTSDDYIRLNAPVLSSGISVAFPWPVPFRHGIYLVASANVKIFQVHFITLESLQSILEDE